MSKIQKKWKNIRKIAFFLMLCGVFFNIFALHTMLTTLHLIPQNKNLKKPKKKLLKLFFKNEKWTFIFVHFLKLKKSFKKIKRFSVFFQSPKIAFLVFQIWKFLFLEDVLEYFAITGSKKTSGFVICLLTQNKKNERFELCLGASCGSKKTSGIVICSLTEIEKSKMSREHYPVDRKRSKTNRKKIDILFYKITIPFMLSLYNTTKKSADARFFGPFHKFFLFFKMEKIQKKWKNIRKIAFFLMLCTIFFNISALHTMLTMLHFIAQNKNLKKPKKKLLKLFLKNEKWTFIFVHFLKLKKSFKK